MVIVHHRVNTLDHLARVAPECGVEIDIRDYEGDLRLTHEPFATGDRLDDFLAAYRHSLLILNTKCDGLERRILDCVERHRIRNFFFLDTALPTMVRLSAQGERHFAVRYSEFEPLPFVLKFAGRVDWVWIDCFRRPLAEIGVYDCLRRQFRTCLVSPELEGHSPSAISLYGDLLRHAQPDAICTDFPDPWTAMADSIRHGREPVNA